MVAPDEIDFYKNRIQSDPSFKAAYGESLSFTLYADQQKPEEHRKTICQEPLRMVPQVIYAIKDFYLLDEMNAIIENLKSGGFFDFWRNQLLKKTNSVKELKLSKSLKLKHFQGSFGILVCGSFASFIVFLLEIAMKRVFK